MRARGEQVRDSVKESGEAGLIEKVVQSTADAHLFVALDIGANQGEYTHAILRALPHSRLDPQRTRIHAFEPVPSTRAMYLEAHKAWRGRECVECHPSGLSDVEGKAPIAVVAAGAGTNSMHFGHQILPEFSICEIQLQTLASFAQEADLAHIHLVKVDTEGNDAAVIRGALPLLAVGSIDVLQFEYNHRWVFARAFLKDVFDMIVNMPYIFARVDVDHLTCFDGWHPELERYFQSNYVLVHQRAQSWFRIRRGAYDKSGTYG